MVHVVVLSGAGVSAESGLATFRDSGGLWEGYDIEEVASIEGWHRNRSKVLGFYNLRREQAAKAHPNEGHYSLSRLEEKCKVTIVTQNVDDLHERAGSTRVMHLHGRLREARSEKDPAMITDIGSKPIHIGDKASDGAQLRPNIVWFGEPVPMIEAAASEVSKADIFIVVGTSLVVYPAAGLIDFVPFDAPKYIVDPSVPDLYSLDGWTHIREGAAAGLPIVVKQILTDYKHTNDSKESD